MWLLFLLFLFHVVVVGGNAIIRINNKPQQLLYQDSTSESFPTLQKEEKRRNDKYGTPRSLIVGGKPSDQQRFPYFTSIHQRFAKRGGTCAGSLITPDMIISAAHCYNPNNLFELVFSVNNTRLVVDTENELTQIRRTRERFSHPFFDGTTLLNDIMIVLLDRPIKGIQPIRLDLKIKSKLPRNNVVTTMGLGRLQETSREKPNVLHSLNVNVVSHAKCDQIYREVRNGLGIDEMSQFCAGGNGKDTCQGDSGGPLIIKGSSPDKDLLVGITSGGVGCGRNPGFYTRVSHFRDWIMTIVCTRSAFPFDDCNNHLPTFFLPPPPTPMSFRANYVARFQHLLDLGCSGYPLTIEAHCRGRINILGKSHDSIECTPLLEGPSPNSSGNNGFKCINRCIELGTCNDVYLTNTKIGEGKWGEVYYSCESNVFDDIGTNYNMAKAEASCDGSQILENGRNFMVGQLGIYCFDSRSDSGGYYSFQDYSFDCDSNDRNGKFDLKYTCFSGRNCGGDECSFELDPVRIDSDTFRTAGCVESLDGSPVDPSSPIIQQREPGTYTAQFRGDWQLELEDPCFGGFAKITISCTNGIIHYLDQLDNSTECFRKSDSTIECQEQKSSAFVGQYNGVFYECTSENELPLTVLTYHDATTRCEDVSEQRFSRQKTQLGVQCGDTYVWDDYYFECEAGDSYQYEFKQIYTCFEEAEVLDTMQKFPIDQTRIFTDYRWSNFADESCFNYQPFPTLSPTTLSSAPSSSFEICFSGETLVQVKHVGTKKMKDIVVGDEILIDQRYYERVYSFGHRDETHLATFVRFEPSGLELSGRHLVFVVGKGPIPASQVRVGDLFVGTEREIMVESIHVVIRRGVFNPYTPSGTILVNGVVASNYISLQTGNSAFVRLGSWKTPYTFHWVEHGFQVPHRIWCHWMGHLDHHVQVNGFSVWSEIPFRVYTWAIKECNTVVLWFGMLGIVGLLVPVLVGLECLLFRQQLPGIILLASLVLVVFVRRRTKAEKGK